jgi:mRNA-degrading endonuclease RelE of RelBE toxin-antitoxin system
LAEWELRVDRFRVFYDLDEEQAEVKILAVGHKRGSRLHLRGEEFTL